MRTMLFSLILFTLKYKYWKSIKKWRINNSYGNLLLKMEIRCSLQQSLQELDHKLCTSGNLDQELLNNFAAAKEEF